MKGAAQPLSFIDRPSEKVKHLITFGTQREEISPEMAYSTTCRGSLWSVDVAGLRPMKAVSSKTLPRDEAQWAYEIKWDGMRVLAHVTAGGVVTLRSGNGNDTTVAYPELGALGQAAPGVELLLDGEVVALDDAQRPSFGLLQSRMHVGDSFDAARRAAEVPVAYVVFDVLALDGVEAMSQAYEDRRRLLEGVLPHAGPSWILPEHQVGDGEALLAAARERGLEGVVAKRRDSQYLPGKRSPSWVKVKVRHRQEVVVGGWQPGEGNGSGLLGSLLVGHYEGRSLRYAGRVGTGFGTAELERLRGLLADLAVPATPFDPPPPSVVSRSARWVRPELVAEVEFAEWTSDGVLRHASYLGLRDDKAPTEVEREL